MLTFSCVCVSVCRQNEDMEARRQEHLKDGATEEAAQLEVVRTFSFKVGIPSHPPVVSKLTEPSLSTPHAHVFLCVCLDRATRKSGVKSDKGTLSTAPWTFRTS